MEHKLLMVSLDYESRITCEEKWRMDSSLPVSETWKVCDYMSFNLYSINSVTFDLEKNKDFNETLQRVEVAKKMGIKSIFLMGSYAESTSISKIAGDTKLREDFINRTTNTILNHKMDGVFVDWSFPGCPQGKCNFSKLNRPNTAAFYIGFGKLMGKHGKITVVKVSADPTLTFQAGDYFSDIVHDVDFYYATVEELSGHWAFAAEFHSNLMLLKKGTDMYAKSVAEPYKIRAKTTMGITLNTLSYGVDKLVTKIGAKHTRQNSFLPLNKWCKLVEPASGYKVVKDREKQNYAVKDGHLFVYDDVDSLKAKVQYLMDSGGAGVYINDISSDDPYGECGCGKWPRLKAIGEFVKSKTCEPLLCP